MGLRPIDPAAWLPPADDAARRRRERDAVLAQRPDQAHLCPAAARPAAAELLAMVREALGTDGHEPDAASPLLAAAARVPDDLCLLDPDARLRAGVLTAPSGWRLDQRVGHDLRALHAPVEGLDEAIGARMRAFLERLPAGRVFERGNWSLYDDNRYWRAEGDALGSVPAPLGRRPEVAQHLWLRCERQTLRRLPASGWLCFTIRVHLHPVTRLAATPRAAADLREAMASLTPREQRARRLDRVGAALDAWLADLPAPDDAVRDTAVRDEAVRDAAVREPPASSEQVRTGCAR